MATNKLTRDYSDEGVDIRPTQFHTLHQRLFKQDQDNYNKVIELFNNSTWFAKKITPYVKFLEYSLEGNEAETLEALIYSFSFPGTSEAIIKLCQGLFGLDSNVVLDESVAGVVNLAVENVNVKFRYGWVSDLIGGSGIVEPPSGIAFNDFTKLAGNDLEGLIEQFIPAGWKLIFAISN